MVIYIYFTNSTHKESRTQRILNGLLLESSEQWQEFEIQIFRVSQKRAGTTF